MAFNIEDPETDRLVRELADVTGESLTEAIRQAVQERLARESRRRRPGLAASVRRVQERVARLPVIDARPADALLGYDEYGLPT